MNIREETLKIARNLIEKDPSLTDWVISKFPELKESGDERIRKYLINYVKNAGVGHSLFDSVNTRDDILLWLENQGKKESVTCPICGWEVEKQCEQKPADKFEPMFNVDDIISDGISEVKIVSIDKKNKYYNITNGEIENDANICNWVIYFKDQEKWKLVKSKDDKKHSQPKQEWSEEDEVMLNSFLHKVEVCSLLSNKENVWIVKKLKSLRPQKQWKPTEEQLKSLKGVIDVGYFTSYPNSLETLYEQLKNLI